MQEGKSADRIFLVGNLMIDTLVRLLPSAENNTLIIVLLIQTKMDRNLKCISLQYNKEVTIEEKKSLRRQFHVARNRTFLLWLDKNQADFSLIFCFVGKN